VQAVAKTKRATVVPSARPIPRRDASRLVRLLT
jgi:hypothetical protein